MSLRTRLVAMLALLVTLGLVAADVATYVSLRSFLLGRVDQTLAGSSRVLTHTLLDRGFADPRELQSLAQLAPGTFIQIRDARGTVVGQALLDRPDAKQIVPKLPAKLPGAPQDPFGGSFFGAPAVGSAASFRGRVSALPGGAVLVTAISLASVKSTLDRLLWIELVVTVVVVVTVLLLARLLVNLGLRPLREIEGTAARIAEGDLAERVPVESERTEVGRLGLALNAMLGRLEDAFARREASERQLRRFVADASHELRTPLAAVTAYAELFERGAKAHPDDLDRAMAGISREAQRMGVLVDDLLLLARLDQGRPLEREPVDLRELAEQAVEAARAVEPGRPLALDAPDVPLVSGDRDRLRQVLDNLLANVRAHTPAGTPAELALGSENGSVLVRVHDDGPGLPPEAAAHVFEPFFRGDESRSRASGGAGLGLSIVKAITEAHGGSVSVESAPERGTTFVVRLPRSDEPSGGQAPAPAAEPALRA